MPDDELRRVELELARIDLAAFEATGLSGSSRPPAEDKAPSLPHKSLSEACSSLSELLGEVRLAGFSLSDSLHRRFFSHAGTPAPTGL